MTGWGIMGTGRIARRFAEALAEAPAAQAVAVASRDAERAATFARDLGLAQAYGSYAALLADPAVRLVYIALPPSLHATWATAALQAGKHVLCEKPLATSAAEVAALLATAHAHGVWLMEGFMYRFHPQTQAVERLLAEGALGEVRLVRVAFGITVADPANFRFSAELGGGALGDVGSYCVSMARLVTGQRPVRVSASAQFTADGVDELLVGTLEYPSGAVAQISCGLRLSRHQRTQIVGSAGSLELDESFSISADQALTIRLQRGAWRPIAEQISIPAANHFRREAEAFAALVAAGDDVHGLSQMPLNESLDNALTIDALLCSAREGRAIAIEARPAA